MHAGGRKELEQRMKRQRGLIIFPGALGDLLCLLPAMHVLQQRYPTIEFEVMARPELARFAERRMGIVAGHSIDRREVASLFSEPGNEPQLTTQFFANFDSIDCFFASDNERFRSSLRRAARGEVRFYPFRPAGEGHVAECYLRAIGADTRSLNNFIELTAEDQHLAEQRLSSVGLEPHNFVLVFPGSGSARKNWPAQNFVQLAEWIEPLIRVLVVLGPAESRLAPLFEQSVSIASNIELGELAAIAHLARCFVGNDSGVSHLAAAAGAPGVVIFGPTDPERWRPLGEIKTIRNERLETLPLNQVWAEMAALIAVGHRENA